MKDKHGKIVEVGDLIRVLEIYEGFLNTLPEDERILHEEMLHQKYVVDEILEDSTKASVSFFKDTAEGVYHGGLYMLSHEFEIVRKVGR
ncbi:hypothetical protein [Marinobacterium stanieri]|uniref:hypothetical protein n=1 Tax=Marinobacterium stanieri TaxID=49186 RepID=UPI000255A8C4|nr:hypothetical protein [Marinobacterium stanieri]